MEAYFLIFESQWLESWDPVISPVGSHPLSACFCFLYMGADNSFFFSFSAFLEWPNLLPLRVYHQPHLQMRHLAPGMPFPFLTFSIPQTPGLLHGAVILNCGWVCSAGDIWQCLKTFWLSQLGCEGWCYWHLMAAAKDCTVHRTLPYNKKYQ